ncbi:hypothetical protein TDB9533_00656 [Thalassocella blandensis]|nr:hypothetical protein TDB9533_00656 [Thalassocella blandensis]
MTDKSTCPVCNTEQPAVPDVPDYVCMTCLKKAIDTRGRHVEPYNVGVSGGVQLLVEETGEAISGDICFIEGAQFKGVESRMGPTFLVRA